MIDIVILEWKFLGFKTVFRHIIAKITGKHSMLEEYWISKQKACEKLTTKQIEQLSGAIYKKNFKKEMPWNAPQTFDEKIRWSMLYDATPLKTKLADKYLVRDYVKEKVGEEYLIPLLGVWDNFDDIDFSSLPKRFVLKLNNGSGMNIVVKDKDKLNIKDAKKRFERWMQYNFAYIGYEMQYRDVPLKIIAEEYQEQMDGNLYDYKIHCYDGKVHCCQVIGDRDLQKHTAKQIFLDTEWNLMNIDTGDYELYDTVTDKPLNWKRMIEIAEKLSEGFCYVRIDLYSLGDKILFGEFTFSPAAGLHPRFSPQELNLEWGNMINLPKPYHLDIPKRVAGETKNERKTKI